MTENKKKRVIGRIEKINLPELSGYSLDAKIDTGINLRSSILLLTNEYLESDE